MELMLPAAAFLVAMISIGDDSVLPPGTVINVPAAAVAPVHLNQATYIQQCKIVGMVMHADGSMFFDCEMIGDVRKF